MKIRHVVFSMVLVGLLGAAVAAVAGEMAMSLKDSGLPTSVKMQSANGGEASIAQAAGEKGTLVVFTCNACPWVKAWEERIVELGNRFAKRGVGVIAINANDPARFAEDGYDVMKERASQRGMEYPYVVDSTSEVARAFDAKVTPEAFLFDAAGKLVYHGTIDDNAKEPDKVEKRYLEDALEAVVSGREVPVKETKALGCSIKFRS